MKLRMITVKYDCGHLKSVLADPADWEKVQIDTVRDSSGAKLQEFYRDHCDCTECREAKEKAAA